MATVLVSLISRQPMPNYIGARVVMPDKMIYFVTPQEGVTMEYLQSVLQLPFETKTVHAFDFQSIREAFRQVIQQYKGEHLILNLTGGTKIMALSAFDIARENAIPAIYVNTAENKLIHLQGSQIHGEKIPEVVDVPTYLKLHGHQFLASASPTHPQLAGFIGENIQSLKSLLLHLRGIEPQKPYRLPGALSPKQRQLIQRLNEMGLLRFDAARAQVICRSTEHLQFIKGGWLEEYVFLQLQRGKPHDIRLNVKVSWKNSNSEKKESKNEFDIMLIHGNQLHIFECKSGKKAVNDIHRLEALWEIVGGTYGIAYYVFTGQVDRIIRERIHDFKELRVVGEEEVKKIAEMVFN